ncbi:MAG TPA: DUF6460 domain-containing protein [Methylovirgula sp.]|nr:DUF6460 domain-containing protein [Methylovirgula sp.]
MIDETKPASAWSSPRTPSAARWHRPETPLARFLGGTPLNVALRLFFLSLIVGALLMWLDIRPADIVQGAVRFVHRVWSLGFDALRDMGDYLVAGAMIVVPLWLIARLLNMREPR